MTKTAISVSLGSSKRDKKTVLNLLGEDVILERRGTDGDVDRAAALFKELDGKVDALGFGGMDLWLHASDDKLYPIRAAHKIVAGVKQTPLVDGHGLKNTLEARVVDALVENLGENYRTGRVMLTAAVDRYGMTKAFFASDYEVMCGDMMFGLGLPIPIRSERGFRIVARLLVPVASRLPISILYPTGEKQEQIVPKFGKWYNWATVIAGDCHYIKQHMPADLSGTVIVTNTTTEADMVAFRERGVEYVLTTTPVLDGRSFGTNMMEAALTAIAGKGRPLNDAELNALLDELQFKPTMHRLG
ncbi:MAG: hypothetical protein KDE59_13665 [Anaerolineales bacterium]|nr:hypothetical protein [Anaerolineales bacterium]